MYHYETKLSDFMIFSRERIISVWLIIIRTNLSSIYVYEGMQERQGTYMKDKIRGRS